MQYTKYTSYVIFYVSICLVLLKVKSGYFLTNRTLLVFKNNQSIEKYNASINNQRDTRTFNVKIQPFEYDKLRSEYIESRDVVIILQKVSEVCAKRNLSAPLVRKHFLYSWEHRIMYCWIRKVASTSFTKLFSNLRNRQVIHNYYREIDILAPESPQKLKVLLNDLDLFKLLIVRHPFERLVSSYRDRIEDNSRYTAQAWIYAQKIFHLTRPMLFHSNKRTGSALDRIFDKKRRLKLIPTFKEFVTWLLQEPVAMDDVHWSQYHSHCSVCDINYNLILKLEDYTMDQIDYIFSKLGVDKSKVYLPRLEETHGGLTDFDRTCTYFKSLSQDIVSRLHRRYKIDFEMFNYEFNKYIHCAKGDTTGDEIYAKVSENR